jgi:hypothetical protein
MSEVFKTAYPNKHLTNLQLITSLKEKKIKYDSQIRYEGIKGSFIGVVFVDNSDVKEPTNIIEESNLKELNKKYYDAIKLNEELEKRIKELEKLLTNKVEEPEEPIKKVVQLVKPQAEQVLKEKKKAKKEKKFEPLDKSEYKETDLLDLCESL